MLDIKFIRENKDIVQAGAKKKLVEVDIDGLITLDDERLKVLKEVEELRTEINRVSSDIGRDQDPALKVQLIEEMRVVKEDIKTKEEKLKAIMEDWQKLMLKIPNILRKAPMIPAIKLCVTGEKNHSFLSLQKSIMK